MAKVKRPKPIQVGKVRIRVHSGPREDGRWRWRADRAAGYRTLEDGRKVERRVSIWSGWGTPDEAEDETIKALAERGETFVSPEDLRTVHDLLDVWVADYEKRVRSPNTSRHRRYCADRIGPSELGAVVLTQLSRHAIERYRDQQLAKGAAASTTREDLVTLRMAWTWARERAYVPDREIPVVKMSVTRRDAVYNRYTPKLDEIAKVLWYLRDHWEWAYRAARLLFATGARRHEIAQLRWDRVDLEGGFIRIPDETKTGERLVALHPDVVAELRTWSRDTELVHGVAEITAHGTLNNRIRAACKALDLPLWSTKGLRYAAVRQMFRSGADPGEEGAQLGHSPKVALRHYDEVSAEELAEAVKRARLGVLPERPPEQLPENVVDLASRRRG